MPADGYLLFKCLFFAIEIWKKRIARKHRLITKLCKFQVQISKKSIYILYGNICYD